MLSDRFHDYVVLASLRKALNQQGTAKAFGLLVVIAALVITVDYAHVLWRRRRLVSNEG